MPRIRVKHFGKEDLDAYARDDFILRFLHQVSGPRTEKLGCHRWLLSSMPKRMIYQAVYGDLLESSSRLKVLDVGGGVTGLLNRIADRHDYTLVDLLAHDDRESAQRLLSRVKVRFLQTDWYESIPETPFDVVIANDLFPNVDQRIALFVARVLPLTGELRLLLTYYSGDRFYRAKRTDAEEILFVKAWTGRNVVDYLVSAFGQEACPDLDGFLRPPASIFPNGRHVTLLTIQTES